MGQKKKAVTRWKTGKGEKGKGKGKEKSVMFARLDEEEMDPRSEEIPESGPNKAYRRINLANVLGGNDCARKNWKKNVLALSTQVLTDEDYADYRG